MTYKLLAASYEEQLAWLARDYDAAVSPMRRQMVLSIAESVKAARDAAMNQPLEKEKT